jgi:hypothetical protein
MKISKKLIIIISFGAVFLIVVGIGAYFFWQYQTIQSQQKNPTAFAQKEQKMLVKSVELLMALPTEEEPIVATVSDVNRLQGQTFFAHAKNGQKVLLYMKAKKAILYDPQINKVIEVGPINTKEVTAVSPTPTNTNIVIYNGTTTVGFATTIEKQLKAKMPNVTVIQKTNASSSAYPKTLIVDLTGKQTAMVKQLATVLNGEVRSLPTIEKKPISADILVILGE